MKNQVVLFICLLFLVHTGESLKYTLIGELEVAASASEVWAFFASNDAPKMFVQLLPGLFERIEILEGDGGVGSVLRIVYPAGSVPLTNKEKFVTIDDRRRLKEILQTEGGYLDLGVTNLMESFQITRKGANSCIIKSMINYEVPDDLAANVAPLISIEGLINMAKVAANYIIDSKNKTSSIADM
ncbi:hypothetical protein MKW94_001784 [Papaver nudicaule]|uniref:Bet v I/Major latex protein domain-containing protein n=1 Tax=Papaver nudicaule TaxID=74823 RepID=A0AA41SM25_PAPNU|nr:hypothetical protein [Papaver nudicaule]